MANTALDRLMSNRVEQYLDYLEREWSSIPALAAEWDTWDEHSRSSFVHDWPISEDRYGQLSRWANDQLLDSEQMVRFGLIRQLINRNRPTLELLLAT